MRQIKNTALFNSINEVPCQYPWLSQDEECEVLVIGGGTTGCIAAHTLSRAGIDTLLISANPIGFSSICTDSATLANQNELMLTTLSEIIGRDNALTCFGGINDSLQYIKALSDDIGGFDFEVRNSFLYTDKADKVNDLHAEYLMRKHNGFDVEFMEKSDARERFSFAVQAGILTHDGAGELDGYKLCHVLLADAQRYGARVYENTVSQNIINTDDGCVVLTEYGKRIKANKVVLATGYKQDKYLNRLTGKKTSFFLATAPLESLCGIENKAITRNISDNVHLRSTACNRMIIGGLDCTLPDINGKFSKVVSPQRLMRRKYDELSGKLSNMLCAIDGLETEYEYYGIYGTTKDYLPIVGEYSPYPNIYFNMPTSLHGILYAVMGASIIKKLYLGDEVDNIFSPNRPSL